MIDFPNDDNRGHFAGGIYFADLYDAATERRRVMEADQRTQARIADWVVRQLVGVSFGSPEELQTFACARAVECRGRALTADEHARLVWAACDVWFAHAPTTRYEITERGRRALVTL